MLHIVQTINSYLSDYVLIILLLGLGLWFSKSILKYSLS